MILVGAGMGRQPGSGYTAGRSRIGIKLMSRRVLQIAVVIVLASGAVSLLAACGQKGPLYFPEEEEKKKKSEQQSYIALPRKAV